MQRHQLSALTFPFLLTQSGSLALAEELSKPVQATVVPARRTKLVAQPVLQEAASPSELTLSAELAQIKPSTRGALIANLLEDSFNDDLLLAYRLSKSAITRLKTGSYNAAIGQEKVLWKKFFFEKVVVQHCYVNTETRNN